MDLTAGRLCPGSRVSCVVAQYRSRTSTTRPFARKSIRILAAAGEPPAKTLVRPQSEELKLQQPPNGIPPSTNAWTNNDSSPSNPNDSSRQLLPIGVSTPGAESAPARYAAPGSYGPGTTVASATSGPTVQQPLPPSAAPTTVRPPGLPAWPAPAGLSPVAKPVQPTFGQTVPPAQWSNQPSPSIPLSAPPPSPPPQGAWPPQGANLQSNMARPGIQPQVMTNRPATNGVPLGPPQPLRPAPSGLPRPAGMAQMPTPTLPGQAPPNAAASSATQLKPPTLAPLPAMTQLPGQARPPTSIGYTTPQNGSLISQPSISMPPPSSPAGVPVSIPGPQPPQPGAPASSPAVAPISMPGLRPPQPGAPAWSQSPAAQVMARPPSSAIGAPPITTLQPRPAGSTVPQYGAAFSVVPANPAAPPPNMVVPAAGPSASAVPTLIPAAPPSPGLQPPPGMLNKPELRRPEPPSLMQKPALRRMDVPAQVPRLTIVVQPSMPEIKPDLPRALIQAVAPLAMPKPPTLLPQTQAPGAPAAPGVEVPAEAPQPLKIEFVQEEEELVYTGEEDEEDGKKKGKKGKKAKEEEVKRGPQKITAEMKREARKQRKGEREAKKVVRDKEEIFEVGEDGMSVGELADMLQVNEADVMLNLFTRGITCTANSQLDKNTVKVVAKEYEVLVLDKTEAGITDLAKKRGNELVEEDDLDSLVLRPPVVTIMGHVDHGKTSLLDFIRKTRVASGEAGGITQQIGAYTTEVDVDGGKRLICFLDTPGHEAFSAMRARGARITDIAVIIVAADDGLQPQTREAISHAQAAEVPIVVAINKIDKPGADVERTKQQLLECNLVPEEWGGSTPMVALSAKTGKGVDDLLLTLLLMAEEMALMANPDRSAKGTVIEAHLDKKTGPVCTLLVQAGTLRPGDIVQAGGSFGKVRQLLSHTGKAQKAASPGMAVQMLGLSEVPHAGDTFEVWRSEAMARMRAEEIAESMREQRMSQASGGGSMVTLSSLATLDEDNGIPGGASGDLQQKLNLVIKGDTQGVVEAIKSALSALPQQGVMLRYLWAAAGDVTQADLDLALASNGLLLAFNLQPSESILIAAKEREVNLRTYKVIYDLLDDVRAAMEGKLAPVEEKLDLGRAEVKAVFGAGSRRAAGCVVLEGRLRKGCLLVIKRKKEKVHEGQLTSLRRIKDNVDEVAAGLECGIACEGFTEWQEGDIIEAYETVTKNRKLEDIKARTAVDMATILA